MASEFKDLYVIFDYIKITLISKEINSFSKYHLILGQHSKDRRFNSHQHRGRAYFTTCAPFIDYSTTTSICAIYNNCEIPGGYCAMNRTQIVY